MDKVLKITAIVLVALILISSVNLVSMFKNDATLNLFEADEVIDSIKNMEINMTSVVYVKDTEGNWQEYQRLHGEENRIWVELDKIPKTLIDAFISIEDERFYSHVGVDWKRTSSALLNQFIEIYSSNQGGSTITQQLIKNITGDNEQNFERKLREIARALIIERKLSKEEILEAYLNTISLGKGICGVQVAANYYFNKDVSELTLLECASIAAITKNPSAYNPEDKLEGNKKRSKTVLKKMYECKKITHDEYVSASNEELVVDDTRRDILETPINSYFIDTLISNVISDLSEKYNCSEKVASTMLYNGGYKIYSTVDLRIQGIMENHYLDLSNFSQISKKTIERVQSAMTIVDYSGHIVGVVGGVGEKFVNRGLNRAVDSPRQPGSTMKPIGVYAPAIDAGVCTSTSVYVDSPLDNYYPDGKKGPREWYGYYAGNMSIQKALERSANTIPCKILKELGVENSFEFLTEKLGLKHLKEGDKNLASLALGGCQYGITTTESASAYAVFGNGGKYYKPVTYYYIENTNGDIILDDGVNIRALKPATANIMNQLLQNVVYGSSGTGRGIASYSKMKAYAKTGTSSESNDLWMVAGTPYYVGSLWYGFDKPEQIHNQAAAATLWKKVMSEVHDGLEFKEFTFSDEVVESEYCAYTGKLAGEKCYWRKTGQYVPGIEGVVCDGKHVTEKKEDTTSSTESTAAEQPTQTPETATESQAPAEVESQPAVPPVSSESSVSDTSDNSTPETDLESQQ